MPKVRRTVELPSSGIGSGIPAATAQNLAPYPGVGKKKSGGFGSGIPAAIVRNLAPCLPVGRLFNNLLPNHSNALFVNDIKASDRLCKVLKDEFPEVEIKNLSRNCMKKLEDIDSNPKQMFVIIFQTSLKVFSRISVELIG